MTRRFGQQNGEEKVFLPWQGAFERSHNLINPASKFQVSIVEVDLHGRYLITKLQVEHTITGSPNAVLAYRKIRCIYPVLANKIIICVYLCSCVFMSRFGRDLNPIRDG